MSKTKIFELDKIQDKQKVSEDNGQLTMEKTLETKNIVSQLDEILNMKKAKKAGFYYGRRTLN